MKKKILVVFTLLLYAASLLGQGSRTYNRYQLIDLTLQIDVSDGQYLIRPYTNNILETTFIPAGEVVDSESHAVVLSPVPLNMNLTDTDTQLTWSSEGISVTIQKTPFAIRYSYKDEVLLSEKNGYSKNDTMESIDFTLDANESLYGGGARALGMNRRGNLLELYNKAHYGYEEESKLMNYTLPIVLSSKRYMLHFDNAPIGWLDLDSKGNNTLAYHTISGRKTYQIIAGETWADLMDQYTGLTGKQPLPPRWTFGNFSSRFGYHSEKETRETVDLFLKDSIPLDAVVIDIYWFGAEIFDHMGNLEFLRDSFPTPYQMISDFEKKGIKTILVTEPFILTTSNRWQEAVDNNILATNAAGEPYTYDFYFGNTGIIDIYDENAFSWFWDIYKYYTEKGVGGWWGDLGEPEVHPSDLVHATGMADEVHNIYGHDWARLIYEGYQKDFPDQRPFILMRAGYSGSQRYGLLPWSGDVSRSWGGLVPQTEIALQMGMQGLAYMHSDLGGFGGGEVFDPELYTRWLQYGVFQPLFRPHAQEHIAAEPVFHDENTKALAKKAIELRYSLLPYNYSLAYENSATGMPLMRPLFFEEPDKASNYNLASSYFWGEAFLVTPVTDSLIKEQDIYLPATADWVDFYTDDVHTGGQTLSFHLQEDYIPVFVRSGSFVPMADPVQSTSFYSTNDLKVHYYSSEKVQESNYSMYDDDGVTPNSYAKGLYELLDFQATDQAEILEIAIASKPGENYQVHDRNIKLIVHQLIKEPSAVLIGQQEVDYSWDEEKKHLLLSTRMQALEEINIQIRK